MPSRVNLVLRNHSKFNFHYKQLKCFPFDLRQLKKKFIEYLFNPLKQHKCTIFKKKKWKKFSLYSMLHSIHFPAFQFSSTGLVWTRSYKYCKFNAWTRDVKLNIYLDKRKTKHSNKLHAMTYKTAAAAASQAVTTYRWTSFIGISKVVRLVGWMVGWHFMAQSDSHISRSMQLMLN